jgi:uncharacterized phage protein gp47/JayE
MPFSRPSLAELVDRVQSDIEVGLPGADARTRRSVLDVLARAEAGAVHGLYGYLAWLALQAMPDTAEIEHLDRWSRIWGVARKTATQAAGPVAFAGTDGVTVPAGTTLRRSDGAEYATLADATIAAGAASAAVEAAVAGAAGNTDAGVKLSLVTPIAGVQNQATVAAGGISAGEDVESDDRLRDRLLERIRKPPQGGAAHDYVAWTLEVAGATRAWVYPEQLGAGTVEVLFVMDDKPGTIIPDAGEVADVQAHIDARRPVTAAVTVAPPTAVPLNLTIRLVPASQAVKDAVAAAIADLLRREAEPGGTILHSHLEEAVSLAAGETDSDVQIPAGNVVHGFGQIAVMGAITWS